VKQLKQQMYKLRDAGRRILGRWLFDRPLRAESACQLPQCRRILLIRWDAKMGDAIVSSFLFRELRKANPDLSIEVITTDAMAALFQEQWHPDRLYRCSKRAGYKELAQLAAEIGSVDLVVHFSKRFKMKDLYFIRRLAPQHLAGLDDELACINIKLGQASQNLHFADKFAYVLQHCGLSGVDSTYWLPSQESSEQAVRAVWPTEFAPVIAINPFGAGRARKLDVDSIYRLITLVLKAAPSCGVCLLYSPNERELAQQVAKDFIGQGVFIYVHSKTIYDVIAQIRAADGLISVDTATVHIASALQRPLLGLYNPGAENYTDWGPNNNQATTIFSADPYNINKISWSSLEEELPLFIERMIANKNYNATHCN
jgi:ADP-heptose:LPS heptosyltransferase